MIPPRGGPHRPARAAAVGPGAAGRPGRACLLILGMHRSATSATAGALVQLGATAPTAMLAARADNPKGFFEPRGLAELNDAMLARADRHDLDPRGMPAAAFEGQPFAAMVAEARSFLESAFLPHTDLVVLKDPRLCLLAPVWLCALRDSGREPLVIVPVRHPSAVGESLRRRDSLDPDRSVLLWLRYLLDAEFFSRGLRRVFFDADDFIQAPAKTLAAALRRLAVDRPQMAADAEERLGDFIDRRLFHPPRISTGPAADWAERVHRLLGDLQTDPSSTAAAAALDAERAALDAAAPLLRELFDRTAEARSRAAHEAATAAADRAEAQAQAAAAGGRADAQAAALEAARGQVAALRSETLTLREALAESLRRLDEGRRDAGRWEALALQCAAEAERLERSVHLATARLVTYRLCRLAHAHAGWLPARLHPLLERRLAALDPGRFRQGLREAQAQAAAHQPSADRA